MVTMETAIETDYLKAHASNIWFVLGAYLFAFFPWAVMNNVGFISEKWRTCRLTRKLARIHLASSILPIIYLAVYAEAQRRDGDNKELGAALAALMFNVFQLMRTIMGWVQLNAFVAWCKDAMECIRALEGDEYESSSSEGTEGRRRDETKGMMEIMRQWKNLFVSWCKGCGQRMRIRSWRGAVNGMQRGNGDEENRESSVTVDIQGNDVDGAEESIGASPDISGHNRDAEAGAGSSSGVNEETVETTANNGEGSYESYAQSSVGRRKVSDTEDVVMVNNMVVENEVGVREVTVLPSWEKIWSGLKQGRFTPSKWLRTDRAILNTVRWGGAYLCGMGEGWSVGGFSVGAGNESGKILESFFSKEMETVRNILLHVEWDMTVENDSRQFFRIHRFGDDDIVELTGEMSTAYGNRDTSYRVSDTYTVDAYAFQFNSLVGSYPSSNERYKTANREMVAVGLVHSVLLAKHLGVEKLKAIRRYYDGHRLQGGSILRKAFELLLMQTKTRIPDDTKIWEIFALNDYQIPIFPYRMQTVALWDKATNWRVLQASAHQDSIFSHHLLFNLKINNGNEYGKRVLHNAPNPVDIFNSCSKWTIEQFDRRGFVWRDYRWKGLLGVVMETVRTFFAEWVTASAHEANWEPEIPRACVEFNTGEKRGSYTYSHLTWICQRELQRKVARMPKEENLPGNAALIILFILGFPLLRFKDVKDGEVEAQDSQGKVQEASALSCPNIHCTVDLNVEVCHVSTPLAPQDISLIIQIDKTKRTASLRLQNNSGDARFIWQDWVDAAMGCMKGFEEAVDGEMGYGRKIVRAQLGKPMVELCPLLVYEDGIEPVVEKTSAARVWTGWPAFDVRICKFEVEEWADACGRDSGKNYVPDEVIENVERVIEALVAAENEMKKSTQCGDV